MTPLNVKRRRPSISHAGDTAGMDRPPRIAVYCGASPRAPEGFLALAREVGVEIGARGWELVYGGGSLGLMGACALGALSANATVTGVTTRGLAVIEPALAGLTTLFTEETMHARKLRMTDLADAFLVLPGGCGTLDETFEALTWRQLDIHDKPIVILNHDGYYTPLVAFIEQAVQMKLIGADDLDLFSVAPELPDAFAQLDAGLRVRGHLASLAAQGDSHLHPAA